MSESAISSLLSIVKLSVIIVGVISVVALTRGSKSTSAFWETVAKLFKRLL